MARFTNGWVKVHRRMVEEDIGQRGNYALGLMVRLLRMANWRDGNSAVGGQRVKLQPGQLATGLRELSPNVEEDPYLHRVRNALGYLEKRGTITQATSNQGRIITICNWDEYQFSNDEPASNSASEAQADRKQGASEAQHIEEVRSKKKEIIQGSPLVAERKNLEDQREVIEACYAAWLETLAFYKAARPQLSPAEQLKIVQAVQRQGSAKAVLYALRGARYEPKGETFDPAQFLKISRVLDVESFDRFMNLGIRAEHKKAAE